MPIFAAPGPFAQELRRKGLDHLRASPSGRYANAGQWLRAAGWTVMLGLSAMGLFLSQGAAGFLWAFAIGLFGFFSLATLCHDAAHGSLSSRPWLNRLVLTLGFGLFGIAGDLWRWRHIRLHHMFPNVEGIDIDGEGSLILRLAPHGEWRWWHRYQAFYAPLLYTLVFAHLAWIDDWRHRAMARRMAPDRFRNAAATFEFVAVKLAHISLTLVLPWLVIQPPLWGLVIGYLIFMGVSSVLFIVIVAGSHLSEEAEFISPNGDRIPHDWAMHQILTSVDWAPQNRLAGALSGGSNAHTAHHLFPDAAHCHNADLSRLVSQTAATHRLRHNVTSFFGMVGSHFGHLRQLGQPPVI